MGHNSKCFVPNCKTGYNSCKKKYSLFSAPKDEHSRILWAKAICRADRELTERDVICSKHFVETDVKKVWISGNVSIFLNVGCESFFKIFINILDYNTI